MNDELNYSTRVADQPNILWICTDQQRADTIGALGNPHIRTPNLDALAAQGVAFTRAYCQSPVCTPSRASFLKGLEIQMLELDWVKLHTRNGKAPPIAYVHGELFGAGGLKAVPDNPRGKRSKSLENRCKGRGQWNVYDVVCVDGVVKLSVNGKFVNGISHVQYKKGYLCLESEGAEIHFRNMKIMELPPGITSAEQTAPLVK